MNFKHCPDCGAPLSSRILGDEGEVPWCDRCGKPWFPVFPVAAICLVHNEMGEVLLLRQNYISEVYRNLVSGYVTPGERCEETACREIEEETGLRPQSVRLKGTWWFEKKQMMMVGFFAEVEKAPLRLSEEVDEASWHSPQEAVSLVHPYPYSVSRILSEMYLNSLKKEI
ncbi:MAG: NUDIX domain-containing protein [Muribaculaceae bacterium]|nr:NUDIX domain-containing protein [Muribaculaceae bacterium]